MRRRFKSSSARHTRNRSSSEVRSIMWVGEEQSESSR